MPLRREVDFKAGIRPLYADYSDNTLYEIIVYKDTRAAL